MADQVHKYGPEDENTDDAVKVLNQILAYLVTVDEKLDALTKSNGELVEFTTGMANAINDAKSGKGMGAMMANMLPTLPVFGQKV